MAEASVVLARLVALVADVPAAVAEGVGFAAPHALLLAVVSVVAVATVLVVLRGLDVAVDAGALVFRGQTVDPSRLLAQCDPDAAGSVRPRAPGRRSTAA